MEYGLSCGFVKMLWHENDCENDENKSQVESELLDFLDILLTIIR